MTDTVLKISVVFFTALFVSFYLTPLVAKMLAYFGLVDKPSHRRINTKPIPRGGGIALIIAFFFAMLIACNIFPNSLEINGGSTLAIAASIIIVTGLLDDIFSLNPFIKLVGQIAAAVCFFSSGYGIADILPFDVPYWVDCVLTVGWIVMIVNAFNLIDGLDGLSTGLAFIGSLGLSICLVIRGKTIGALPLFALMGASLGFLRYNFNPASVFLGDTGAMFLGFILAVVPLVTGGKAALLASIGVPLLVIGVPIFDTALAIIRRSLKARILPGGMKQVFLPDMEHLHHRFLSSGISQRGVAVTLYVLALVMVFMAVGITVLSDRSTGVILIGVIIVAGIMSRQLTRVELWYTGEALFKTVGSKWKRLLVPTYVICDVLFMFLAWWFSADLAIIPHIGLRGLRFTVVFPFFFAAIFGAMWIFHVYHRIWTKSYVSDYLALIVSLLIGWTVAYSAVTLAGLRYPGFWRHSVVFLFVLVPFFLAERMVRVSLKSLFSLSEDTRIGSRDNVRRIVVYGAGERFSMFDMQRTGSLLGKRDYCIVGVIDDDPLKYRRLVHGYRIAGGVGEVENIVRSTNASSILLVADIDELKMATILGIARENNVEILRFDHSLTRIFDPEKGFGSECVRMGE